MSIKFDLGSMQMQGSAGLDALFSREPQLVQPAKKVRLASINQLQPFVRLSADTLIHKSNRDLWAIKKEADGSMVIERMFDDSGAPLKG